MEKTFLKILPEKTIKHQKQDLDEGIKYSTKTHESKQEKSTHIPGEKYQILKFINYFQLNLQMGGELSLIHISEPTRH